MFEEFIGKTIVVIYKEQQQPESAVGVLLELKGNFIKLKTLRDNREVILNINSVIKIKERKEVR